VALAVVPLLVAFVVSTLLARVLRSAVLQEARVLGLGQIPLLVVRQRRHSNWAILTI